jgi:hypothetical protein
MTVQVAVVNASTVVQDADVQDAVAALQIQVSRDFVRIWGRDAQISFLPQNTPIPAGTWQLLIADNSDQAGALGYHELTVNGDPLGKVFAKDDIANGNSWTVTASHELLEMLADPWANASVENDNPDGSFRFYALEVCDACEDDQFGYQITIPNGKNILVSDFVLPSWFQPLDSAPYDFQNKINAAFALLQNGYIGYLDAQSQNGWQQLNGQLSDPSKAAQMIPKPGHRRHKRMIGAKNWRRSNPDQIRKAASQP